MSSALPAVSLFSNCGAGDLGYATAGFNFEVLAELDARRLSIAQLNLPDAAAVPGDLRQTWRTVVETYRERHGERPPSLLAACPPCQGMSSARSGRGRQDDADAGSRDERNLLVAVIASVTHALRPDILVVENVPAFLTRRVRHPRTGSPVSAALLLARSLKRHYEIFPMLTDLADFGVPQTRKRAFICFVRRDLEAHARMHANARAPFPRPTHDPSSGGEHITLEAALRELAAPSLDSRSAASAGTGMHAVPIWNPITYRMVSAIPANSGRGAWENSRCLSCNAETADIDAVVCTACGRALPRPVVPDEEGSFRLIRGFRTSSYRRMRTDSPAATITTASGHVGSDRTIHPSENRLLSPYECAHLQGFPPDFKWGESLKKWGYTNVRAMIGEAVPPTFTELHGEVLAGFLTASPTRAAIATTDPRVVKARRYLAKAESDAKAARATRATDDNDQALR